MKPQLAPQKPRQLLLLATLVILTVILVGCGSSASTTTAPAPAASATTVAPGTTEATPSTTPATAAKDLTIGITLPTAQNFALTSYADAIRGVCDRYGIELIQLDDQGKVEKHVADLEQLVAQDVDAIITWAFDPQVMAPVMEKAKAKGIKLFCADYNAALGGPQGPFITQANISGNRFSNDVAEYMAANLKPGANVVGIGIAWPVPSINAQMVTFKNRATELGLHYLEQQDNQTDDAAGARTLAVNMLTKYKDLDAIYAYNEPSAIGASAAVTTSGRKLWDGKEGIMIFGRNGGPDGAQALQDGKIWGTSDGAAWKAGYFLAEAAAQLLTGKKTEAQLPKEVEATSPIMTKENMATVYHPYSEVYQNVLADSVHSMLPPELQ